MSIKIFFKCGCSIPSEERQYFRSKTLTQQYMCKEHHCNPDFHNGLVDKIELTCSICHKKSLITLSQMKTKKCLECSGHPNYIKKGYANSKAKKDYHFKCNCIMLRSEAIIFNKELCCPVHKQKFKKKTFICRICKTFVQEIDIKSGNALLCQKCINIEKKRKASKVVKKKILKIENITTKEPTRISSCIKYENCMAIKAIQNKHLDCSKCRKKKIGDQSFYIADTNFKKLKKEIRKINEQARSK